jgi:hypothetical protein
LVAVGSVAAGRDRTPPTTPANLRVVSLGPIDGAPVTEHVNWWGERTVVLRHLTPATSYRFTVQASDSGGTTATSNAVTLTTEATSDVTPPSAPTNVRIVADQGCGEVWVGWTQSTGDVDAQSAIEYEIDVNGVLSPLPVGAGIDRDFVYGHGAGRENLHGESGGSGREHLGGEQRGDGGALALLRSRTDEREHALGQERGHLVVMLGEIVLGAGIDE